MFEKKKFLRREWRWRENICQPNCRKDESEQSYSLTFKAFSCLGECCYSWWLKYCCSLADQFIVVIRDGICQLLEVLLTRYFHVINLRFLSLFLEITSCHDLSPFAACSLRFHRRCRISPGTNGDKHFHDLNASHKTYVHLHTSHNHYISSTPRPSTAVTVLDHTHIQTKRTQMHRPTDKYVKCKQGIWIWIKLHNILLQCIRLGQKCDPDEASSRCCSPGICVNLQFEQSNTKYVCMPILPE